MLITAVAVFITGRLGTGKTELLRDIARKFKEENKKVICTATTGLSASTLPYGATLHKTLN